MWSISYPAMTVFFNSKEYKLESFALFLNKNLLFTKLL